VQALGDEDENAQLLEGQLIEAVDCSDDYYALDRSIGQAQAVHMDVALPRYAIRRQLGGLGPGVALCAAIAVAAWLLQAAESELLGRAWLEAIVLAILVGATVRLFWTPGRAWAEGIQFSAKTVLEVAVVLLGATVDARTIAGAGVGLLAGIAAVVTTAIAVSYGIGRLLRLPRRMSILIACGNAICGNSAIAAVAPVIGADGEDVTAAIAFTAVLGVGVVLGLPAAAWALGLSHQAAGVLAGLTVYAVPQVLAATAAISPAASQVGTLVKLVRVLMLGPVVTVLSFLELKDREATDEASPSVTAGDRPKPGRPPLRQLVPWFILGFLAFVGARSIGVVPAAVAGPSGVLASVLTVVSMAALGLGVDFRALAKAGLRVSAAVTLSLGVLALLAVALLRALALV
jgi:uncharacterized integral membrane protein (TIGR00698 family)